MINIRAITIYKYVIPRWTGKQYMQSRNRDEERSLHGFRVVICQDPLSLFPLRGQRDDALRDFTKSLVVYLYCRVSLTRRPSLVCARAYSCCFDLAFLRCVQIVLNLRLHLRTGRVSTTLMEGVSN